MNHIDERGSFNARKSRLMQMFSVLTEEDLMFDKGMEQELFVNLQMKPGKTKEELHNIIMSL